MDGEFQEPNSPNDNEDSADEDASQIDDVHKPRKIKRWQTKKNNKEYQQLFSENKHIFDMSCDVCAKVFKSLEEARTHYLCEHGNSKGYIKCGRRRVMLRCQVVDHITRHLYPEKFKCVFHDFSIQQITNNRMIYVQFALGVVNVVEYFFAIMN